MCIAVAKNKVAVLRSNEFIALSTLGAQTAIALGSGITITQNLFLTALEALGQVTGLTAGEGTGLMVGIANRDLDMAQIAECLVVDGPLDLNDKIKAERASRFVKLFGAVEQAVAGTAMVFKGENGSMLMKTNPKWLFTSASSGFQMFIWNNGIALTTGATARLQSTFFGSWII